MRRAGDRRRASLAAERLVIGGDNFRPSSTSPSGRHGNEVAIGIVLEGHSVLMGEKCDPKDPLAGLLILPGGHIEGGEDPAAGAAREVEEETGVKTRPVRVVGTATRGGNDLSFVLLEATGGAPRDGYELKDVRFYDVSDAMGRTLPSNLKMIALARDLVAKQLFPKVPERRRQTYGDQLYEAGSAWKGLRRADPRTEGGYAARVRAESLGRGAMPRDDLFPMDDAGSARMVRRAR